MLAAEGLLKALSTNDNNDCKNHNNDTDFGSVLDFYGEGESSGQGSMITYSDGTKKVFSFED